MRIENRKILLSFLYGSQNYGLNNPDSDRDFVTVYMPSVKKNLLSYSSRFVVLYSSFLDITSTVS